MQIRLYLDEDTIRRALVDALRKSDVDVVTVSEVNNLGRTDTEQLIWATEQSRVIYSFNVKDFCRLHKIFLEQDRFHAGIVLATRQSYSVGDQLRGLLRFIATKTAEEMRNQQEFLGHYIRAE